MILNAVRTNPASYGAPVFVLRGMMHTVGRLINVSLTPA